jgi:hypothetical protein
MKRGRKVLVFLVAMLFFALFGWGIGVAAAWWKAVQVSVCGGICAKGGDVSGLVFWVQMIGLVLVSVCGVMWITLPDEAEDGMH